MHDANQDRLMIRCMGYFRVKWHRLPAAYAAFLEEVLAAGGTLLVVDCRRTWRVTRLDERRVFQHGATGGLEEEEYFTGSPRLKAFLNREGAGRDRWDPPPPDDRAPEAEWGFEPALLPTLLALASRRDWRVRFLVFEEPEDLSPLVADLYRWWYRTRGLEEARLLAETFIALDPWWTLRTASVPFWPKFPVEGDARALERYLAASPPFPEIGLTLFCHGVESAGWVPADRWPRLLGSHAGRHRFLGVNPHVYPLDFASFIRLRPALEGLPTRAPMPPPLGLDHFDEFLRVHGHRYAVGVRAAAEFEAA